MNKCEFCGSSVKKTDKFCKTCGNAIKKEKEIMDAVIEDPNAKNNNTTFIMVIIVVLLLIIVSLGLFYLFK
jgi:uncharacterized membrane protein YvbJ